MKKALKRHGMENFETYIEEKERKKREKINTNGLIAKL